MKIFALWGSGLESAPEMVRRCLWRWKALNPTHELVVFERESMREEMRDYPDWLWRLPITDQGNILRIHLLARYGGVWTDATVLPVLPLDEWLPPVLRPSGFFAFARAESNFPFDNWFMAALPDSRFCELLLNAVREYWDRPREYCPYTRLPAGGAVLGSRQARLKRWATAPRAAAWEARFARDPHWAVGPEGRRTQFFPYFWFHLLAHELLEKDEAARALWRATPTRLFDLTAVVQRVKKNRRIEDWELERGLPLLLATAPVHKLDWRVGWPEFLFEAEPAPGALAGWTGGGEPVKLKEAG